jgi:hypothetical protein
MHKYRNWAGYVRWVSQQRGSAIHKWGGGDKAESYIARMPLAFLPLFMQHVSRRHKERLMAACLEYFCSSRPGRKMPVSDRYLILYTNKVMMSYYVNMCHSETQWPNVGSRQRTPDVKINPSLPLRSCFSELCSVNSIAAVV